MCSIVCTIECSKYIISPFIQYLGMYLHMQYSDDSLSIQKNQVRTKGVCTPLKKFTVKYKLGSTIKKVSMIVKHFDFDDAMFSKNQLTTTSNSFFHIAQKKVYSGSPKYMSACV